MPHATHILAALMADKKRHVKATNAQNKIKKCRYIGMFSDLIKHIVLLQVLLGSFH